jgi:hypothetical protein
MFWEEAGEPWLHLAFWSADEFRWSQDPADADAFRSSLSDQLTGRSFLCHDAGGGGPVKLHTSPGETQLWSTQGALVRAPGYPVWCPGDLEWPLASGVPGRVVS